MRCSHSNLLGRGRIQHHQQSFHVLRKSFIVVLHIDTKRQMLGEHIRGIGIHTKISRNIKAASHSCQQRSKKNPGGVTIRDCGPTGEGVVNTAVRGFDGYGHPSGTDWNDRSWRCMLLTLFSQGDLLLEHIDECRETIALKDRTVFNTFQREIADTVRKNVNDAPASFPLTKDIVETYRLALQWNQPAAHQYLIPRHGLLLQKFKMFSVIVFKPSCVGA